MIALSSQETNALEALARFQYLSASQMQRYGVGKSRVYIRAEVLPRLIRVRPALIKGSDFGVIPKIGRLEKIYHLTETGAKYVAESLRFEPSEIVYPKYGIQFKNDYFHRKALIDFHISLRLWENQAFERNIEFFNAYYTKGKNKLSVNMIRFKPSDNLPPHYRKTIEPDGIFSFTKQGQASALLCALEVHIKHDTKYITKQLDEHITALDQKLLVEHFDQEKSNIVLSVHENLGSFRGVQKRLLALPDFADFLPYFHFNIMDNIRGDNGGSFTSGWITADEKRSDLFR